MGRTVASVRIRPPSAAVAAVMAEIASARSTTSKRMATASVAR